MAKASRPDEPFVQFIDIPVQALGTESDAQAKGKLPKLHPLKHRKRSKIRLDTR